MKPIIGFTVGLAGLLVVRAALAQPPGGGGGIEAAFRAAFAWLFVSAVGLALMIWLFIRKPRLAALLLLILLLTIGVAVGFQPPVLVVGAVAMALALIRVVFAMRRR